MAAPFQSPFPPNFFSVGGGTAQPEFTTWKPAEGAADVSMVDDWINPLLMAKATKDINQFNYGRQIGAERGAEQNRLAQEIEIKRRLEDMMKQSGLGAGEGQDLDVTDPFSPEAQAARLRYQIGRQGSQDELFDAQKRGQIANVESLIEDRAAKRELAQQKMEQDAELKRESLRLQGLVAEGRLNIAEANQMLAQKKAQFDQVFKNRMMEHWGVQEGVASQGADLRRERFLFDQYRYQNPNVTGAGQTALAELGTIAQMADALKELHDPMYTGGLGSGTAMEWLNSRMGIGGQEAGDFYAMQAKVRDRLVKALSGANVPEAEMKRVIQGLPTSNVADVRWQSNLDATLREAQALIERYSNPQGPQASRQLPSFGPQSRRPGSSPSASDTGTSALDALLNEYK